MHRQSARGGGPSLREEAQGAQAPKCAAKGQTTKDARREELLLEGTRQINASGVSPTLLADIADKIHISRAGLYYYIKDRQDLVFSCYRRSCEILSRCLDSSVRSSRDALERLTRFVTTALSEDSQEFAALTEIGYLTTEQREVIVRLYNANVAKLTEIVRAGSLQRTLRPCNAEIIAHTILSMIYWVPIAPRWMAGVAGLRRDQLNSALAYLIAHGLSADRAAIPNRFHIDLSAPLLGGGNVFDRAFVMRARREALVTTAAHLFNQKGIDGTSMEDIAVAAGATKRTILHHFGDKGMLVGACYRRTFELMSHIAEQASRLKGRRIEALAAAWFAVCEAHLRDDIRPLIPLSGFDRLDPPLQEEIDARARSLASHFESMVEEGRAEGSVRTSNNNTFPALVAGACNWLAKDIVLSAGATRSEICREITEFLMFGLDQKP